MPDIIFRDVEPVVYDRLQARAQRHGRTLEAEVESLLKDLSQEDNPYMEYLAKARQFRAQFAGQVFSNSADLIREDRDR